MPWFELMPSGMDTDHLYADPSSDAAVKIIVDEGQDACLKRRTIKTKQEGTPDHISVFSISLPRKA